MNARAAALHVGRVALAASLAACAGEGVPFPAPDGGGGAAGATSSSTADATSTTGSAPSFPDGTPHVVWLQHWGARSTSERVAAAFVEPDDDVVVTGTIGTFDLTADPLSTLGAEDVLLARFSPDGDLRDARALGGPLQNGPRALAGRADGTLTMMGTFAATFPAFEPALETAGGPAVFVAAFAEGFESLWGRAFLGAATGRGQVTMATTQAGSVVVAGTFRDVLVTEDRVVPSTGPSDAYVARLTPDGDPSWLVILGGPDVEHLEVGASVAIGEDVMIAGQLRGTLRSAAGAELATSTDAARAFVARFDASGALVAFRLLASTGNVALTRLVPRPGGLLASVALGDAIATPLGPVTTHGEGDATLLWLDGAGAPQLAKTWGDDRSQQIGALDVDATGHILAGGSFLGAIDFGDRVAKAAEGRPDGFAVALGPSGLGEKTLVAGDAPPAEGKRRSSQTVSALGRLSTGDAIVCGNFAGTMVLGDATATSAGSFDGFVARVVLAP